MAQFSVASDQIIDPSGNQFVARRINVFPGQVDAATILQTFPGLNAIRLAATPGADPNTLSGQALVNEASWYAGLASKYPNNPDVWFGTVDEPDNSADLQAIPDQEAAIYDAIRGSGSKAISSGPATPDSTRSRATAA